MKSKRILFLVSCILAALIVIIILLYVLGRPMNPGLPLTRNEISRLVKHAESGDRDACWLLAEYYEEDYEQFVYWNRKGAMYGDPRAQYFMYNYLRSVGNQQKDKEALIFLLKSAAQNYDSAQAELGRLYRSGVILKQDNKLAEQWFRKAANNGNRYAMEHLAKLLLETYDDRSSLLEAYKWTVILLSRSYSNSSGAEYAKKLQLIIVNKASEHDLDTSSLKNLAELQAIDEGKKIPQTSSPPEELYKLLEKYRMNWEKQ